jgi:hypothetical protein
MQQEAPGWLYVFSFFIHQTNMQMNPILKFELHAYLLMIMLEHSGLCHSQLISFIGFSQSNGFLNIISEPSTAKALVIEDSNRTLAQCLRVAIDVGTLYSFLFRNSLDLIPAFINPCTVFVDPKNGFFLSLARMCVYFSSHSCSDLTSYASNQSSVPPSHLRPRTCTLSLDLILDKVHHLRGRSSCSHYHAFFSPEIYKYVSALHLSTSQHDSHCTDALMHQLTDG